MQKPLRIFTALFDSDFHSSGTVCTDDAALNTFTAGSGQDSPPNMNNIRTLRVFCLFFYFDLPSVGLIKTKDKTPVGCEKKPFRPDPAVLAA